MLNLTFVDYKKYQNFFYTNFNNVDNSFNVVAFSEKRKLIISFLYLLDHKIYNVPNYDFSVKLLKKYLLYW